MRFIVVALLVAMAFAGCAGDAEESSSDAHGGGGAVTAPHWQIGEYWTFSNMDAAGNASTVGVIVTGESGGEWIVDTNEPQQALYDARTDVSYLGTVRKSDLAGSQGSDRVQFFDFPLEVNKTWTTRWDGLAVEMQVMHIYGDGRVHIQARSGGALFADYEYDNATGFFAYVDFYDDEENKVYSMEQSDHGTDFTGTVYRYGLGEPIVITGQAGPPVEAPFTLEEGVTELGIALATECTGPGNMRIALQQPENGQEDPFRAWSPISQPEYVVQSNCPDELAEAAVIPAVAGPWRLDGVIAAQAGSFEATLEPRSLEEITIE